MEGNFDEDWNRACPALQFLSCALLCFYFEFFVLFCRVREFSFNSQCKPIFFSSLKWVEVDDVVAPQWVKETKGRTGLHCFLSTLFTSAFFFSESQSCSRSNDDWNHTSKLKFIFPEQSQHIVSARDDCYCWWMTEKNTSIFHSKHRSEIIVSAQCAKLMLPLGRFSRLLCTVLARFS